MSKKFYIAGSSASFGNLYSNDMDGVNEYATAADNSAFSFTNGLGQDTAWSWIIWVKRDATGIVMAKYTSGGNAEWEVNFIGGFLRFILWNATNTTNIGRAAPIALIPIGTWVGLAGTYSGSEVSTGVKLYTITGGVVTQIDNANITSGGYTGMTNGTSPLYFGAFNNGGVGSFFNGKLYHPQLWTGALTTAQLGEIGTNPYQDVRLFSFGANAISAWHFQNGTSDYPTWTDYVNARNATMQNAEAADINTDKP